MLVDSHCHLDFPDFSEDLDDVVENAVRNGVTKMLSIATTLPAEPVVRGIAQRFDAVYYAAGVHPMQAHKHSPVTLEMLLDLAHHRKMVAFGETGLDYHYTPEHAEVQKTLFRLHIEAARQTGLPVIVHARAADDDIADILRQETAKGAFGCVLHCFASGATLAETARELGFYVSMSGISTFKKAQDLRDIIKTIPVDRILVETDAPYLAPDPYRGKRNEPAYTRFTAQVGADLFEMPFEAFAKQTTENFHRLFSKVPA
jgi:TatD DNase family protein